MGRPITLAQGVKRWYDIPLTDEEIMIGVRSDFVSLSIGPAFDSSNNPLVDAVEVYALPRDDMHFLHPNYSSANADATSSCNDESSQRQQRFSPEVVLTDQRFRRSLDQSLLSVMHVSHILEERVVPSEENRKTLQRLVQVTAVDSGGRGKLREHVIELLKGVEQDSRSRQVLIDEGTLFGIAEALKDIKMFAKRGAKGSQDGVDEEAMQDQNTKAQQLRKDISPALLSDILGTTKHCLEMAVSIASDRPGNYITSLEKMAVEGVAVDSVAVMSKDVLDMLAVSTADFAACAGILVKLALIEKAIEALKQSAGKSSVKCADFDVIASLIRLDDTNATRQVSTAVIELISSDGRKNEARGENQEKQPEATSHPIAYQCDSCGVFPITDLRYTLEGGHDIDLCQKCYDAGSDFARGHRLDPGTVLTIRGKTVRLASSRNMTCSQLWQMRKVSIAKAIVEQVEQAKRAAKESSQPPAGEEAKLDDVDDDERALQLALQMSLETQNDTPMDDAPSAPELQEPIHVAQQSDLVSELFTWLLDLAMTAFSASDLEPPLHHPTHLLNLLLFFVWNADSKEAQLDRGTKIATKLCERMRIVIETLGEESSLSNDLSSKLRSSLVMALQTLVSLSLQQRSISEEPNCAEEGNNVVDVPAPIVDEKNKDRSDKTDPRFVCDIHGVPAVRRRCSRGENKDRRFYVCGMERKRRCNYFKWADADSSDHPGGVPGHRGTSAASKLIQSELWKLICGGHPPLQTQLCDLMQVCFERSESSIPSARKEASKDSGERPNLLTESFQSEQSQTKDWYDGVFMSRERL
eukprot:CAMPEP_0197467594 /NCGR_PEP_ID=MMETSP1175-20131217/65650_1 /TAXON_ID=1003142 /ORGANISM="Triceratium dubium, Strain CCMP147" /LENGTH=809 /DNA_ID=CAMNT_0043003671 /DNA_START=75 /DNA_END=2501 /DNA_ORIENTATION=-